MEDRAEEYWGSSSVTKKKAKVNIFDDDVTVEAAGSLAKFRKNLESLDDEEETVNWDDTPVSRPSSSAVSRDPVSASRPQTGSGLPRFDPAAPLSSQPNPRPETSYTRSHNRSQSDVLVGSMGKMSLTKSPSIPDSKWTEEPSISTIVGVDPARPVVKKTATRQEEENAYLRQELLLAQSQGGVKIKVEDTIRKMTSGKSFQLEPYKSKEEKLLLLDKAIETHDGNAIITAVIFLKRTLKNQLFNIELTRRPAAVDHYLTYLRIHYDLKELEDILGMLGRTEELAMFKYKQTVSILDPVAKIDRLKACKFAHFQQDLEQDAGLIQQQIDLLMRQRPVEVSDAITEKEGKHIIFKQLPRKASIINMPVITTLYYLCLYHYDEPENLLGSPVAVKQQHQLSEKQYVWTAVRARARLRKWEDIEKLLSTKTFFGGTKLKSVIGFEKIAGILHKAGAPPDKIKQYLMLFEDVEKRLALAQKMECHTAVIDTYIAQKDRRSLEQYQARLKSTSQEWFYCRDALSTSTVKWKT